MYGHGMPCPNKHIDRCVLNISLSWFYGRSINHLNAKALLSKSHHDRIPSWWSHRNRVADGYQL